MQVIRKNSQVIRSCKICQTQGNFLIGQGEREFWKKNKLDREMQKKFKLKDEKIDSVCVCMCERA